MLLNIYSVENRMNPHSHRENNNQSALPARREALNLSEEIDQLLLLLAHCEASHQVRSDPTNPLRQAPEFLEGPGPCWKLVEDRCGALIRIQKEVTGQLKEVHQALGTGIREVLEEEILALFTNPKVEDKAMISEQLAGCREAEEFKRAYVKLMGNWPVERFFDDRNPFEGLEILEATRASVETLGAGARLKPRSETLFPFLGSEMFARFDIALTDMGLVMRKEFFEKDSPEALLQQQRLQCVLTFLVRIGFMAEADRKWIRGLEPAVFEGEVGRAFCLFLKATEGKRRL